jgi:ech hydrogenase subunit D
MIENLETVALADIPGRVHRLQDAGYRFVTITCCENPDGTFDLFYSFDKDLELVTLKTTFAKDTAVRSVSNIYLAAAFVENETAELFGVHFTDLAIDYGGNFILSDQSPEAPLGKGVILVNKDGGPYAG